MMQIDANHVFVPEKGRAEMMCRNSWESALFSSTHDKVS